MNEISNQRLEYKRRLLVALREGMTQGRGSGDINMAIANGHEGAQHWLRAMAWEVTAIRIERNMPPTAPRGAIPWCFKRATEAGAYGTPQWIHSFVEYCSYWCVDDEEADRILEHGLPVA